MVNNIQAVRGMNDSLPEESSLCRSVENTLQEILNNYGYSEIRLPIVERTLLFQRAIGESTDIVEKEMYSFFDRKGDGITLRPEGTAGCVRAGIEHGLFRNQVQRLWYTGPMFRYERPQKGRYRQFFQMGVEVFGPRGPDIEAELIFIAHRWWKALGISEHISLELNSIGLAETRVRYREALLTFLNCHKDQLDTDSLRRMKINPLRVLDTKNPNTQLLLSDAPILLDYLDEDSRTHFADLCNILDYSNISYKINPYLVRGLDYYNHTIFEWLTTKLGSQRAICGGGRYDSLVQQLGGRANPAVGCAVGLERLALLVKTVNPVFFSISCADVYLIIVGDDIQKEALRLAEQLRNSLPLLKLVTNCGGGSLKTQLNRANKHGARIALILGQKEIASGQIILKDLVKFNQELLPQKNLVNRLATLVDKNYIIQ